MHTFSSDSYAALISQLRCPLVQLRCLGLCALACSLGSSNRPTQTRKPGWPSLPALSPLSAGGVPALGQGGVSVGPGAVGGLTQAPSQWGKGCCGRGRPRAAARAGDLAFLRGLPLRLAVQGAGRSALFASEVGLTLHKAAVYCTCLFVLPACAFSIFVLVYVGLGHFYSQ